MPKPTKLAPKKESPYNYRHFSQLSGPFSRLPKNKPYSVQYKSVLSRSDAIKTIFLVLASLGFQTAFLVWLFLPSHISFEYLTGTTLFAVIFIITCIALLEALRLFNIVSLGISTLLARDPVPVHPERNKRLAFTTTIVPGKEPFEMAEKTLRAMLKVKHDGPLDVWLLDEGNVPEIKAACEAMGVKHFSRKGIEKWNTESGAFKAKTKHGNHNAWLDEFGDDYDYVISVDTDHVPHANYAQRFLGYFRDPDVAYVVGPQVYGNYDNIVTKCAESQAYIFQAAIQRGGNAYDSAMFVGTNHAYRVSTWKQIGGFQDSITEDMLTGMTVRGTRNPKTGKFWKSVYSPDVVAVGEGPSSWTDFFSQQLRWARGSNELLVTRFLPLLMKMPFRSRIYYLLIAAYYPSVALSWMFGIFAGMVYLTLGQVGLKITGDIWMALYADVTLTTLALYAWFRKFNVSPHEKPRTLGFGGIFFGTISAPIFITALISTFLRSKPSFVVTAKGDSSSPDSWMTFKKHIMWAVLVIEFLIYSVLSGRAYPVVIIWSSIILFISLSPVLVWQATNIHRNLARFRKSRNRMVSVIGKSNLTESKENA